jgi:hypothetical protein
VKLNISNIVEAANLDMKDIKKFLSVSIDPQSLNISKQVP